MNRFSNSRVLKKLIRRLEGKGEKSLRKTIAILSLAAVIISLLVPAFIILKEIPQAKAELICPHKHGDDCYGAPDGHICSEEYGCVSAYLLADDIGDVSGENTISDTTPLDWICLEATALACEHRDCIIGELCELKRDSDPSDGADVLTASIYGFLWADGDGTLPTDWDGIHNGDEQPLAGYKVFLYLQDDLTEPVAQTRTDIDGTYIFDGLQPGSYVVGIASGVMDDIKYLFPLSETDENESKIFIFSNVIVLREGELAEGISVGLRLFLGEAEEPMSAAKNDEETSENHFAANTSTDPDAAFTDVLGIGEDTILTDIDCAMHDTIEVIILPPLLPMHSYEYNVYNSADWIQALMDPCCEIIQIMQNFQTDYVTDTILADRASGTLTIKASNNVVITAGQNYRHFIIPSNSNVNRIDFINVTLDGAGGLGGIHSYKTEELTITGYSAIRCKANSGGAIYADGPLTLTDYSISECMAWDGGGIFSAGSLELGNGDISECDATCKGGGLCATGALAINGNALISNNTASEGGGLFANGITTISDGKIEKNKADFGGGMYFSARSTNTLSVTGGDITGNQAESDGGGIYTSDLTKINIGADVIFSGNTAKSSYWLADYVDTVTYNPGVEIKVSEIKALHGSDAQIKSTAFSSSPSGSSKPFTYLANNCDLNFNAGSSETKPIAPDTTVMGYISDADFGIGKIPDRKTLFGLAVPDPERYAAVPDHVINQNASSAEALEVNVVLPKAATWSLTLNCTAFTANGVTENNLKPVAVSFDDTNGTILDTYDLVNNSLMIYDRDRFDTDLSRGLVNNRYDPIIDSFVGTWAWDRLMYEIKVQAQPASYQTDVPYKSVFTWTLQVAP